MTGQRKVGFVGAGRIGEPMAQRLLSAGHPLRLYARRTEVRDRLSADGAELVDRPADLADCDVIVSCLYSDAQLLDVLPDIMRAMDPHTILLSHTTGRPETLDQLAEYAREGRAALVDAPFSGTADAVRAGRLAVYLGGEAAHVSVARQVVGAYADPIIATGARGTALRVKLLNNLLFAAITQVTLRGLDAGRALGIDERVLLDVLAVSSGGSTAARHISARGGAEPYVAAVEPFLRKDLAAFRDTTAGLGPEVSELLAIVHNGPMELGTAFEKGVA
ncbi:MAG TPA: NAD(P)-binding domain-containing protein [Pseudonocardiaceae bacterium]|nr:NAD(P)-binding domain-containing protein [Pseudonocardiaceae bacterium]